MLYLDIALRRFGFISKLSKRSRSSCYTFFMEPNQQDDQQQAPEAPAQQPVTASETVEQVEATPEGQQPTQLPPIEPVQWQAVEYVQYSKQPLWYVGFGVIVVILMVLAVWLMQAWTFAILILVMAAALMVYSHRPPRDLHYVLSEKGLYINDQLHPMGEFKSFGVVKSTELNSLMLIPVKRFRPALSVYFPTEVGERVVDILGAYLPMQDLKLDAFDKIVQKLRL